MKHILKTEDFMIELELEIFESDMAFPENTILYIYVCSDGFSAKSYMDIDIKDFARFAEGLVLLYTRLEGTVRLDEAYTQDNYLKFTGDHSGHIYIEGCLNKPHQNGFTQELKFANVFDQTYLEHFSNELSSTYHKYLK